MKTSPTTLLVEHVHTGLSREEDWSATAFKGVKLNTYTIKTIVVVHKC